MDPVSVFLLAIAGIFVIGIAGEFFFARTGVPDVIWLIVVGLVLGRFLDRAMLETIAPYFGALTLVIILFDGGTGLRLKELRSAAPRALALATSGFALSTGLISVVAMGFVKLDVLPSSWGWLHCVLCGSILGGSSSVVIMPALRTARIAPRIANLVNLESALTDVLCVVVTGALVRIAAPTPGDGGEHAAVTLAKAFGLGLGLGLVAGALALPLLRRIGKSSYAYPFTLCVLLALYAVIDELGGSAALGILTAAVMVGNAPALSEYVGLKKAAELGRTVEFAHDQFAFIVKSFFFVFIGAMIRPPFGLIAVGVGFGLLLLVARMPAVLSSTAGARLSPAALGLCMVSLPRGMAAGVLAMLPNQRGVADTEELPVTVFSAVFVTILIFAVGFPILRRRLAADELVTEVAAAPVGATEPGVPTAELSAAEPEPGMPAVVAPPPVDDPPPPPAA